MDLILKIFFCLFIIFTQIVEAKNIDPTFYKDEYSEEKTKSNSWFFNYCQDNFSLNELSFLILDGSKLRTTSTIIDGVNKIVDQLDLDKRDSLRSIPLIIPQFSSEDFNIMLNSNLLFFVV